MYDDVPFSELYKLARKHGLSIKDPVMRLSLGYIPGMMDCYNELCYKRFDFNKNYGEATCMIMDEIDTILCFSILTQTGIYQTLDNISAVIPFVEKAMRMRVKNKRDKFIKQLGQNLMTIINHLLHSSRFEEPGGYLNSRE